MTAAPSDEDPQSRMTYLLQTRNLEDLVDESSRAFQAVKAGETEIQVVLHDNYRKFFGTLEALSSMVTKAESVGNRVHAVEHSVDAVIYNKSKSDPPLKAAFTELQTAISQRRICQELIKLVNLPKQIQKFCNSNDYQQALEAVVNASFVNGQNSEFNKYEAVKSFVDTVIKADSLICFQTMILGAKALRSLIDESAHHYTLQYTGNLINSDSIQIFANKIDTLDRAAGVPLLLERLYRNADHHGPDSTSVREEIMTVMTQTFLRTSENIFLDINQNQTASFNDNLRMWDNAIHDMATNLNRFVEVIFTPTRNLSKECFISNIEDSLTVVFKRTIICDLRTQSYCFQDENLLSLLQELSVTYHQNQLYFEFKNTCRQLLSGVLIRAYLDEIITMPRKTTQEILKIEDETDSETVTQMRIREFETKYIEDVSKIINVLINSSANGMIEFTFCLLSGIPSGLSSRYSEDEPETLRDANLVLTQMCAELVWEVQDLCNIGSESDMCAIYTLGLVECYVTSILKHDQIIANNLALDWNPTSLSLKLSAKFSLYENEMIQNFSERLCSALTISLCPDVLAVYLVNGDHETAPARDSCTSMMRALLKMLEMDMKTCPKTERQVLESLWTTVWAESIQMAELKKVQTGLTPLKTALDPWYKQANPFVHWRERVAYGTFLSAFNDFARSGIEYSGTMWEFLVKSILFIGISLLTILPESVNGNHRVKGVMTYFVGNVFQIVSTLDGNWTSWLMSKQAKIRSALESWCNEASIASREKSD